jgi:XTP/dITP diphosphohydrolase
VSPLFSLLIATSNKGKLVELGRLLGDLPVELLSLAAALPGRPQAVEDGATLEDNAWIKGRAAAEASMLVTLAEDSGLEVDALGGRPGVRSARFAGEGATDAENNAALLSALSEVDDDQRTARFRCVMVLIDPYAEGALREQKSEGRCEGSIGREARGTGGFGYDPLFIVAGKGGRTMAELDEQEKGEVSHRGLAALALRPAIEALIARRLAEAARIAEPSPR